MEAKLTADDAAAAVERIGHLAHGHIIAAVDQLPCRAQDKMEVVIGVVALLLSKVLSVCHDRNAAFASVMALVERLEPTFRFDVMQSDDTPPQ